MVDKKYGNSNEHLFVGAGDVKPEVSLYGKNLKKYQQCGRCSSIRVFHLFFAIFLKLGV